MIQRGLRTGILVNMTILLLVGMLLIDFVMTIAVQRDLIHAERSRGHLLLTAIGIQIRKAVESGENILRGATVTYLDQLFYQDELNCVMVLDGEGKHLYSFSREDRLKENLEKFTSQAIRSGEAGSEFRGKTWGVFWTQESELILSMPFFHQNRVVAAAGISISLGQIYQGLRHTQKILLVYMIINTLLLTLVGLYRLSKIYLQPVQRLVRIAEAYDDDHDLIFSVRKQDNELKKLSNALNRMLKRISADKEKLRATVNSLKQANIDLKQAQDEIIRAEKLASIGRLSSGIAHEIGNPIGIIIGYLELLRQNNLSAQQKGEYLSRAEDEINRINRIIRQLLDFSRPSQASPSKVSVHEALSDVANMLASQPIMANLNLKLDLKAESDWVLADSDQLRQIFLNLIINAADAVSLVKNKPGELAIQTEMIPPSHAEAIKRCETLKIEFKDNGHGIPPEHLSNIFDPFYTTKEPGKGTGLGLSVCFMIIENIGGSIKASSEENRGTTMTLYLPLFLFEDVKQTDYRNAGKEK